MLPKIVHCIIQPGRSMFDLPEVFVRYQGQSQDAPLTKLFDYLPDEISFSAEEIVGLTTDEALDVKRQKDLAYIRECGAWRRGILEERRKRILD
jgi:hypothetical protein